MAEPFTESRRRGPGAGLVAPHAYCPTMRSTSHPTAVAATSAPSFVVALSFAGVHRGMAGPFETESAAAEWAVALVEGEADWSWVVNPVVPPSALPLAWERRAARRRLLFVVR